MAETADSRPGDRSSVRRTRHPILVYSLLRLLLLVAVWLPLQFLTPLRGVLAIVVALLLSGVLSYLVLDRQRDAMSSVLGGVFARIDERIERGKAAEDGHLEASAPDDAADGGAGHAGAPVDPDAGAGDGAPADHQPERP